MAMTIRTIEDRLSNLMALRAGITQYEALIKEAFDYMDKESCILAKEIAIHRLEAEYPGLTKLRAEIDKLFEWEILNAPS